MSVGHFHQPFYRRRAMVVVMWLAIVLCLLAWPYRKNTKAMQLQVTVCAACAVLSRILDQSLRDSSERTALTAALLIALAMATLYASLLHFRWNPTFRIGRWTFTIL